MRFREYERIRLGSLEPRIITEEFARTIICLAENVPAFSPVPSEWM